MPRTRTLVLAPALMLAAAASSLFLFSMAPAVRAQCGTGSGETPCPTPQPTPVNAFLALDVTQGDANTVIDVTGGQFLPNEQVSLYWDTTNKVAGSATADGGGSFNVRVRAFAGDSPGLHKLCASVAPNPCADFTLIALTPSPSPSPSPSESPSPSPDSTPLSTQTNSSGGSSLNGFDVITRPPFVFLPIAGGLAIGLALVFWLVSVSRRPRPLALGSAAVVHRATRPDYGGGFGAPAAPAAPVPELPAAAPEPPAETPPPTAPPAEAQPTEVEWGPPVEWGTGSGDWGFPEPPPTDDSDAGDPRD